MIRLDDIKGKVKVEALVGLFVLVVVVAGGILFLSGSATNDTQVATVIPPAAPPAEENTTMDGEVQSALPGSGFAYSLVPVYGRNSNPNYIDLDQFEVPGKNEQSGDNDKEQSGTITPVDQHDDDGDDLWEYPEAEEENLDPEDVELPGDDGFPDDLFPEENQDNETSDNETPDVETPDDIGEVDDVDPTEDEDEFPEEAPDDMPDDEWIDDWING